MFETLFTCPGALRRHREGPLATERVAYLSDLATQGMARRKDAGHTVCDMHAPGT